MILLDALELPQELVWVDRYQYQAVAQSMQYTLGGNLVVRSATLNNGRPITLEAKEDQGWLDKAQVDAVIALASVAGAVYSLDFHGELHSVIFANHEPPAVELRPLVDGFSPSPYYYGFIKLVTTD